MLNITSNMLLEGIDSLFGDVRIANSKITNENYFDTALEAASAIEAEYTDAKAKLYNGLASSNKEFKDMFSKAYRRSFPEKDEKYVGESCTSTEHFISFFGDSIQILNKAAGNIADSCGGICNQAPVVAKEAAKIIGVQEKSEACPVCHSIPCTCKKKEHLFKFTTDHGTDITDFNFPAMDNAIAGKESFKKLYDSMVVEAADVAAKRRGKMSGLDQPIDISLFGEAVISNFRSTNRYPITVNHRYLDYCIETVNSYQKRVESVTADAKKIAESIKEAANKVANVMTASSTMQYIKEDGSTVYLEDDEDVQNMDLYCKAKIDELVATCMEHLISIGAKIEAMKCEYDQCKAVLSKFVCGNPEPVALPAPPADPADDVPLVPSADGKADEPGEDSPAPSDGVSADGGAIQEDPNGDVDYTTEYESYMPWAVDDFSDTRDIEEYRDSYASFLSDMITHEAQLSSYINGEVLAESDQVFVEGAIGKTKGLLHRISEFIKKIWGKFKNAMASVFQNDQKYLSANENTIKNVQPKSANLDQWYNYNRKRISGEAGILSTLNQNMSKLINPQALMSSSPAAAGSPDISKCGDPKAGTANTFVTYFKQCDNPKENNTNDKFRTYFRGYPLNINSNTLTQQERTEMYDYCFNFKQGVEDVLQKDISTVEEMSNTADQAMQQFMQAVEQNTANAEQQQQNQANQTDNGNQQTGGGQDASTTTPEQKTESSDIASVIDQYFTEFTAKNVQDNPPQNGNNQGTTATNAVNAPDQKQVDNTNNANSNFNQSVAKGSNSNLKENAEVVQRYVTNVFEIAKQYVAIKLSMAQNAYQQYMQFFRWHVSQYAGTQQQQQQGGTNVDTSQATVNNGNGNNNNANQNQGQTSEPKKGDTSGEKKGIVNAAKNAFNNAKDKVKKNK